MPGKSSRHTKLVDKLAKDSAKRPFRRPTAARAVRRKRSESQVVPGSIRPKGQTLEIQIITSEVLKTDRWFRYKYEVVPEDSPEFGRVDFLYSREALLSRHVYRVRLNSNPEFPQIVEISEIAGPARRSRLP